MTRMETIASVGRRALPNHWDVLALGAIMAGLVWIVHAFHGMNVPLPAANEPAVSLEEGLAITYRWIEGLVREHLDRAPDRKKAAEDLRTSKIYQAPCTP